MTQASTFRCTKGVLSDSDLITFVNELSPGILARLKSFKMRSVFGPEGDPQKPKTTELDVRKVQKGTKRKPIVTRKLRDS